MTRQAPPHIAGEEKRKDGEGEDVKDRKKRKKTEEKREREKKRGLFVENEAGMKDNAADWGLFCNFF